MESYAPMFGDDLRDFLLVCRVADVDMGDLVVGDRERAERAVPHQHARAVDPALDRPNRLVAGVENHRVGRHPVHRHGDPKRLGGGILSSFLDGDLAHRGGNLPCGCPQGQFVP